MTQFPPARNGSRDFITGFTLPNFEVSWAGPSARRDGFCFGSEDGGLLDTTFGGVPLEETPHHFVVSREAVNGVAYIQRWLAVSTPNEVVVVSFEEGKVLATSIPFGAHDVIASPDGCFIAPLGRAGLMFIQPQDGPGQRVRVSSVPDGAAYFYRVAALQAASGKVVGAVAARQGGVAAIEFGGQAGIVDATALTSDGLDIVDVCTFEAAGLAAPIAAVGIDGTLFLFRDILADRNPLTVRYRDIKGKAYRLLSARSNLILLTSEGLYVITELISSLAQGNTDSPTTPVLPIPLQAVDANVVGDRWVLIVMPDEVLRLDLGLLKQRKPANNGIGDFDKLHGTLVNPSWQTRSIQTDLKSSQLVSTF